MDALDAIAKRRSIREFKSQDIPERLIEKIINAGRLAPTARGEQPWEFIVIREKENRKKIAEIVGANGPFIAEAPVCVVVFCRDTKYYLEDGCAATENILIAATALGLGSCWVAGDKKPYCERIREFLNLPANYHLISLIAIGYPSQKPLAKAKRTLKEVLHWEKFKSKNA